MGAHVETRRYKMRMGCCEMNDESLCRLDERLAYWANRIPDRPALRTPEGCLSYHELWYKSRKVSEELSALGDLRGKVVAFQLPNLVEAFVLYYAVVGAGAVALPILPSMREHDLRYMLDETTPALFVTVRTWRARAYEDMARQVCAASTRVAVIETFIKTHPDRPLLTQIGYGVRPAVPPRERFPTAARPDERLDSVASMIFTSGTSGRPKAVLYSHRNLAVEGREMARLDGINQDDSLFVPSSIAHVSGIAFGLYLPAHAGCCVCLLPEWDPNAAVAYISAQGCTWLSGATPFLQGLIEAGRRHPAALARVRIYRCGGASVPPGLIRQARELGIDAYRCYGLSEHPTVSGRAGQPSDICIGTDGFVHPHIELRIVDPGAPTQTMPPGREGEIAVRGADQSLGYLRPEDTAAVMADGWLLTGDIGVLSPDGAVSITGRKKDIIIRKGENISAKEIEDILIEHPAIRDVAVVGLPDESRGELACCVIVPATSDRPKLADVCLYLREAGLTLFKLPERLVYFDELPYNDSGKVLKTVIKARLQAAPAGIGGSA